MPIRFRCAYCSQLMSIATRKAGTVIRCTKCAGEIIVPAMEGAAPPPNPGEAFESANFDAELGAIPPLPPAPLPSTLPTPEPRSAGIYLSVALLLVSIGVVVLLLIAMFVAGFIIGRMAAEPQA